MIDVHAHICDESLLPEADKIVSELSANNVSAVIDSGFCPVSSEIAFKNAQKFSEVYCTAGVHPEEYKKASAAVYDRFKEMYTGFDKVVAIGEIGLDYHYPELPKEMQWKVFEEQLELAGSLNAPVVLHIRDAIGDGYEIIKNHFSYLKSGILLHCYSGSKEMVKQFERFDCYYSFGGAVTFKSATEKPDVIRAIAPERLLLETDCPYMTPVPYRGKTNYPKYIGLTAAKMAEILSCSLEQVDMLTTENAKRLFPRLR